MGLRTKNVINYRTIYLKVSVKSMSTNENILVQMNKKSSIKLKSKNFPWIAIKYYIYSTRTAYFRNEQNNVQSN